MQRAGRLVCENCQSDFSIRFGFRAWNSHSYKSMLSNEDVKNVVVNRVFGWFRY